MIEACHDASATHEWNGLLIVVVTGRDDIGEFALGQDVLQPVQVGFIAHTSSVDAFWGQLIGPDRRNAIGRPERSLGRVSNTECLCIWLISLGICIILPECTNLEHQGQPRLLPPH